MWSKTPTIFDRITLNPKQVNLKVLSPLVEYSSLEEDEKMQTTWANVIVNISTYDKEQSFNLKCIEILKEITPNVVLFLDFLFKKFKDKEKVTLEKWKNKSLFRDRRNYHL